MGGSYHGHGVLYIGNRIVDGVYELKMIEPNPTHPRGACVGFFRPDDRDGISDFFTDAALLIEDHRVLRVNKAKRVGDRFEIEVAS